jgi:hypothetical protein
MIRPRIVIADDCGGVLALSDGGLAVQAAETQTASVAAKAASAHLSRVRTSAMLDVAHAR